MRLPSRRRAEGRHRYGSAAWLAVAGLILVLCARGLSAAPLLLPGIGLILIAGLAGAWASIAGLGADVRRGSVPRRVIEGQPFAVMIEVSGRYLGGATVTVRDPATGGELPVGRRAAGTARAGPRRVDVVARAGRRGRSLLAPPQLRIADPLALAETRVDGAGAPDEVLVLPRVEAIDWAAGGRRRVGGDDGHSREPTGAGEVDGLRDYRSGTPATRIHWPALARGAGLLERRLVAATATLPLVVLDNRCENDAEGIDALDAAVRAAASLTRELALTGGCALLLPGARLPLSVGPDLRSWPALHTRLALVSPELHSRRGPMLRADQVSGPLLYVATTRSADLTALRRQVPGAVVVAPSSAEDPPLGALFEVAGCRGFQRSPRGTRRAA